MRPQELGRWRPPSRTIVARLAARLRTPEREEEQRCAAASGTEGDSEPWPAPEVLECAHVTVNAPRTCAERADDDAQEGQGRDVLPTFAGTEDEEAVPSVVRDQGDDHRSDDAGTGE